MILFIFQLAERAENAFLNTFRPTGKCQFVDMKNIGNNIYILLLLRLIESLRSTERALKNNNIPRLSSLELYEGKKEKKETMMSNYFFDLFQQTE
jgi:hypothetical protein